MRAGGKGMLARRVLGRTGLEVSPIALGGAAFAYRNLSSGWDPFTGTGRATVHETIHAALDQGINYIDTAAHYGDGFSESLIGEVMRSRRRDCILASKVWHALHYRDVIDSVQRSLDRLQTDRIDIMQVHGVAYSSEQAAHVAGPVLDALSELKARGLIGHIGITGEESWTLIPFLARPEVEVFQIAYNIIQQSAARHFLVEAAKAEAGVVTMRTMTSGIFQHQMSLLAPEWQEARDLYEVCLKFVLADSRVHSGIVGARWAHEIAQNLELIRGWQPPGDFALMPRTTAAVYEAQDARAAGFSYRLRSSQAII